MSIKKMIGAALACLAIGTSLSWGQCSTWTTSNIQTCNGYDYELWSEANKGTPTMTITNGSTTANGGTYTAKWENTVNVLFRAGKKWGTGTTSTPKTVGNITVDFEATWSSQDGAKMLGIYGWAYYPNGSEPKQTEKGVATTFSNEIEYYIIQDRGDFNPASGGTNALKYGEGTIDGIEYQFWVADRLDKYMLSGKGNFKQYFSVPKNTSSHRQSGRVSVSKHFEAWEKAGMKMMDCKLYEVAMKVESYTDGGNGNGTASVTKNILTLGGPSTNEYSLVTNISPSSAGTVTKSPSNTYYAPNAAVQLTATPNTGWKFVGWEGDATGTTSPTSVTMTKDLTVTAKFELIGESTTNLIKDGNFPSSSVIADDGASWKLGQGANWGNSVATSTVSNGTATVNVTTIGAAAYQPQLVQYGLGLDKGMSYKLTFKAKAAAARKIAVAFQQSVDPWDDYAVKEFDLTTTVKDYEFIFTMANDTDPASQFAFNLGQATGSVDISDVKLVYTTVGASVISRPHNRMQFVYVKDRILNVSPVGGTKLQVRVIDVNGKVRANYNVTNAASISLSNIPAGRYIVDVTGAGLKQSTPIDLE